VNGDGRSFRLTVIPPRGGADHVLGASRHAATNSSPDRIRRCDAGHHVCALTAELFTGGFLVPVGDLGAVAT